MPRPYACPVCESNETEEVFRLRGYEVAECGSCGLRFNAGFGGGRPASEVFSREYYYVEHRNFFAAQLADGETDLSVPTYLRRLDQIESILGRGRLLDVGAGLGTFLRLARDRGWNVQGVEISPFAVDHIRRTLGVPVFQGDLGAFDAPEASFDLVTFWDSLEHIERPRESLRRAFQLLRPGGALVLTTDNFDCLIADLVGFLYRASGGAIRYPVERLFIDRNTVYFSDGYLLGLVRGLDFTEVQMTRMDAPLGKITASLIERAALRVLYALAALTHREAQMTLIVRRPENGLPGQEVLG
jgi:SAM-dependent methyltransferase